MSCPVCQVAAEAGQRFCPECGSSTSDVASGESRASDTTLRSRRRPWYRRPKSVRFAGQIAASVLSGSVGAMIALLLAFYVFSSDGRSLFGSPAPVVVVTAAPFEERSVYGRINASSLLPFKDSTFLVVDDLTDDAFYELKFFADGRKAEPLQRHAVAGLSPGKVQDFEGSTTMDVDGKRFLVAISSLENDEGENTEDGFVRITVAENGALSGEVMKGFRTWLVASCPAIAQLPAGEKSLDVQGLAWDPNRRAFLLGIRTATVDRRPLILVIRIKDAAGPWTVDNLEPLESVSLAVDDAKVPNGIYSLLRHPTRPVLYAVVRDSDGRSGAAELYEWDGNANGTVKLIPDVVFHPIMRPEGMAFGTIGNRAVLVIVDDNGGYSHLWVDELPFLNG